YFSGTTVPEIILSTYTTTPGSTLTVTGYAFPSNSKIDVLWYGLEMVKGTAYGISSLGTAISESNGTFSLQVTVPSAVFGGTHYIMANSTPVKLNDMINVTPIMTLTPVTAPLGTPVTVTLNGLYVGQTSDNKTYYGAPLTTYELAYDNDPTYIGPFVGNSYGEYTATLYAVGVPMLHMVQLVNGSNFVTAQWLNVTGMTNAESQVLSAISGVSSQVSSLQSSLSALSSEISTLESDISSLSSAVSSIQSSLSSLSSAMSSDYSSLSSMLSNISSTLSSVQSGVNGLASSLSSDYSSLSSAISSLSSTVSSISSSASTLSTSVSSVGSSVSSLQSSVSSLQSTVSALSTYLIVVAVLAIIIIVLELVILVRKK
ncbi:MAG: hypothetical protein ACP5GH_06630, partial [Nitrososphaeria archaeon]